MKDIICPACKIRQAAGRSHCSNCGTPLLPDTTDTKTRPGEGPAPHIPSADLRYAELENISLEYKHLYLLADRHGVIPFRLINLGKCIIRKIVLHVESRAFINSRQPLAVERTVNLRTSQSTEFRHCDFDINPKAGFFTVELRGYCFDEAETGYAFRGSFSLVVRDNTEDKASLVIKEAAGVMMEEVDIGAFREIVIEDGSGIDMGRMVRGSSKGAATWIKVSLEEDLEQSNLLTQFSQPQKRTPGPVPDVDACSKPHPRAFLDWMEGDRRVHIWCGRECWIGRSPEKSDLVCILLPNAGANLKRNELISSRHCHLKVSPNSVSIEDDVSKNGTYLEGSRITSPESLKSGQVFSLANVLSLSFHDFRRLDETREINRAFNKCQTLVDYTSMLSSLNLDEIREKAPIESFVLRRLDGFEGLDYLFLLKSATLGSSKSVAVPVSHESVSPQHARIILFNGEYFLEDLGSENGTFVNGSPLEPSLPVPLRHAADIRLGEVDIRFRVPD